MILKENLREQRIHEKKKEKRIHMIVFWVTNSTVQ